MADPAELARQKADWQRLQEIAERFEAAWQKAASVKDAPELRLFLPEPDDRQRLPVLYELIKADLEMRWRRKLPVSLDYYQKAFPELGADKDLPSHLIYEEYRARHSFGDRPAVESYRARFPDQFPDLERRIQGQTAQTHATAASPPPTPVALTPGGGFISPGVGDVLPITGGYRPIRRIGSGSFGEVWRAQAPGGVDVAIKIIFRPLDHEEAQRELQSLELIKQLRHPYLMATHSYWPLEDRLLVVMELADGSLRDRLKECRAAGMPGIPPAELLGYCREAAEALDYLHAQHVQHRDIKPDNILLLQRHAKVADFGLARLQATMRAATVSGSGTPAYMATELWRRQSSPHIDQYSLAVTYAELRMGRRPFHARDFMAAMTEHLEGTPDLGPLEPEEQQVLLKALAKDPANRYPSCQDFARALEAALRPALDPPGPAPGLAEGEPAPERQGTPRADGSVGTLLHGMTATPRPGTGRQGVMTWKEPDKPARARLGLALLGLCAAVVGVCGFLAYRLISGPAADNGSVQLEAPAGLVLANGETKPLVIRIRRDRFPRPVKLTFRGPPHRVVIPDTVIPADSDRAEVPVSVPAGVPPGTSKVLVRAEAENQSRDESFDLTVVFLPAGFGGEELKEKDGQWWFERVVFQPPGAGQERVEFVLVRQAAKDHPRTFYIMRDKVWVGLFRRFAAAAARENRPVTWKADGADDDLPALGVPLWEAHRFATEWVHGRLPTSRQWDQAAGRYEPSREGPFGTRKANARLRVAVNILAPLKTHRAETDDVSPFGCRDMSGNGQEWTRSQLDSGEAVAFAEPMPRQEVALRGRRYNAAGPLRFQLLQEFPPSADSRDKDQIGFRVVIEP
jgi:hypothetical protein